MKYNSLSVFPPSKGFTWHVDGDTYSTMFLEENCPVCNARVLSPLPPPLREQQPDDTTHVCHPSFGGCNQGFKKEEP